MTKLQVGEMPGISEAKILWLYVGTSEVIIILNMGRVTRFKKKKLITSQKKIEKICRNKTTTLKKSEDDERLMRIWLRLSDGDYGAIAPVYLSYPTDGEKTMISLGMLYPMRQITSKTCFARL